MTGGGRPDQGDGPRPWLVAATCAAGLGLVMFDNAAVTVALPALRADLDTSVSGLQWIVAVMSLAAATGLPLAGALGDRYGPRRVTRWGLLLFGLGATCCALSPSLGILIPARAVQGLGAALMLPNGAALLAANVPASARPRAVGIWITISSLGLVVGPLGGGYVAGQFGWRWIFAVHLPIALAGVLGLTRLRAGAAVRAEPVDVPAALGSGMALLLLCYGLIELGRPDRHLPVAVACLLAAAATGLARVRLRGRRVNPDPNPAGRPFTAVLAASLAYNATIAGGTFLVSLLLQGTRGFSPVQAGVVILLATVGMPLGGQLTGRLGRRTGLRPVMVGAVAALAAAYVAVSVLATGPVAWVLVPLALTGFTAGVLYSGDTLAVLGAVPPDRSSSGLATLSMVRQVGAVLGVAVLGAVSEVAGQLRVSDPGARVGLAVAGLAVLPAALLLLVHLRPTGGHAG